MTTKIILGAAALAGALATVGCGGSDEIVRTQNQTKVDDDGDVKQTTTVTTTDEDGDVKDIKTKETKIHDD